MSFSYFLLFKTAQAEFRCWQNFANDEKNHITPIIELTRGRKKPKTGKDIPDSEWPITYGIYDYERNIEDAFGAFKHSEQVVLDLTREDSLTCRELGDLANSADGYKGWVEFCNKASNALPGLIPTLIVNPSENETAETYKENLRNQFEALIRDRAGVAYRASVLVDTEFVYDLVLLADLIATYAEKGKKFILELDHEFIRAGTGILHAVRTLGLIGRVREIAPSVEIVVVGTSFPRNVEELGSEDHGVFPTEEVFLYEEIVRQLNDNRGIYYGDYGSINPIRNDLVFARGGWRPRIDFPTSKRRIFYYREKRKEKSYSAHYASVALKVKNDPIFEQIGGSWGVAQILDAAAGRVPASSPSFWISVRMEIFLQQQLRRLSA